MKLNELTITKAHGLLKNKEISSYELTCDVLDHIDKYDDKVGSYILVIHELAKKQAKLADEQISKGNISELTGIPISIKDLICTKGVGTTCASKILENFVPPYNATVVDKLNKQDAVIVGKTNMDEFAMGSSTENSGIKKTYNPWNLNHVPGGSSGGPAASVAADMCLGSLGSDTGGSIRQPASHCGVVGIKPTYGRVSRFGLVAFASSLDQIGPICKDVSDSAILLKAIAGYDPKDSTSVDEEVSDYSKYLTKGIKGLKIGICKQYENIDGIDVEVLKAIDASKKVFKDLGCEFIDVSLPNIEYAIAAYYVIAPCEASSNLARYDGVRYGFRNKDNKNLIDMYNNTRSKGFGKEVQRRIIIGTYSLSSGYYDAYYKKASQVRALLIDDYNKAFKKCDVILSPVAPTPAFAIGDKVDDPLTMYLSDVFTLSTNLAGICGMSVCCGFSKKGLPIGLQLTGNYFDEKTLIKTAYNFEQECNFYNLKPEI